MKKFFLFLFASFCLQGYAQESIQVQIERADNTIFSGFKERIYIDGKQKLTLGNGQSGTISIPAGEHTIYAELYTMKSDSLRFNAERGVALTITPYSMDNFVVELAVGKATANANPKSNAKAAPKAKAGSVENTLESAAEKIQEKITKNQKIAIVYVTAGDAEVAEFIAQELEFLLVDNGYFLNDRSQLDQIRKEQHFQLSGEVDDKQAVSIGKLAGAEIIILGAVTGSGDLRRLRLRALNTQTAQVIIAASEKY